MAECRRFVWPLAKTAVGKPILSRRCIDQRFRLAEDNWEFITDIVAWVIRVRPARKSGIRPNVLSRPVWIVLLY